jgi:hypothetical protein
MNGDVMLKQFDRAYLRRSSSAGLPDGRMASGRLVKAIEDLLDLDNTLARHLFIAGDNGVSVEGGMIGLFNESTY